MKRIIYLICAILLLFSCQDGRIAPEGPTDIRLFNASDHDFTDVTVGAVFYGDLPGQTGSDYKSHRVAYSYAFVQLTIDTVTYVLQPIDFVGETPLGRGRYTYLLDIEPEVSTSIRIQAQKD